MRKRKNQDFSELPKKQKKNEEVTSLSMEDCSTTLRNLSLQLKSNKDLSRDAAFTRRIDEAFERIVYFTLRDGGREYIAWEASKGRYAYTHIAFHIYNMAALASIANVNLPIDVIEFILSRLLRQPHLDTKSICNILYGLGLLAQAHRLQGHINVGLLDNLLRQLLTLRDGDAKGRSNALYGLSLLIRAEGLERHVDFSEPINQLLPIVFGLGINPLDAEQLLAGLSCLMPEQACKGEHLRLLFQRVFQQSYLHPRKIAAFIHYMVMFKHHHDTLNHEFMLLLSFITLPFHHYPPHLRTQLEADLKALETIPAWKKALTGALGISPSAPTPNHSHQPKALVVGGTSVKTSVANNVVNPINKRSTKEILLASWAKARECNPIFDAIAAGDIKRLEQLLGGLKAKKVNQIDSSVTSERTKVTPVFLIQPTTSPKKVDNRSAANTLVTKFLQDSDALALRELIKRASFGYFELLLRACSPHTRYQLAIDKALHPILLYLPLKELKPLIKSLLALGIFQHHQALLSLVDALTLRILEHQNITEQDSELITALRSDLLERCLHFHTVRGHYHVVPRINAVINRVYSERASFLDEEELNHIKDKKVQGNPSLIERKTTVSLNPPVVSSIGHSKASLFGKKHTNPSSRPSLPINVNYQYTTEDIEAILRARLTSYLPAQQNAFILLASAHMQQEAPGNRVGDVLRDYLQHVAIDSIRDKKIIIPINLGNHWVGIILAVDSEQRADITYFNSLQNPLSDQALQQEIVRSLHEMTIHGQSVFPHISIRNCNKSMQQNDGTSCGAFLIENFYCYIKNQWWGSNNHSPFSIPEQIRLRHVEILAQHRPDYHPQFLHQQRNSEPNQSENSKLAMANSRRI